jgi:hypothetical protein
MNGLAWMLLLSDRPGGPRQPEMAGQRAARGPDDRWQRQRAGGAGGGEPRLVAHDGRYCREMMSS